MPDENGQLRELTVRQKILLAAMSLPADGFTIEDLVVRAWTLYPGSFTLTGHAYPDSNRVQAKLCGHDGLRGLGWLDSPSQKVLIVTQKGRRIARQLESEATDTSPPEPRARPKSRPRPVPSTAAPKGTPQPEPSPAAPMSLRLDEADVRAVCLLAASDALRRFTSAHRLTLADAAAFWQGREPAETEALLRRVLASFGDGRDLDSRLPPLSTCHSLNLLNGLLLRRFG